MTQQSNPITIPGLVLALACACLGVAYGCANKQSEPRYAQKWVTGSLVSADEVKHNPLVQSRAVHTMLWIFQL